MVKAWEDTILIPTYERGQEDPNPPLLMGRRNPIHPGSSIIYPYPLQETLFNRKADRKWRIFYLENEYLKLGILPEQAACAYGGRSVVNCLIWRRSFSTALVSPGGACGSARPSER